MSDLISRSKVIDILEKEKSLRCGYDADIAISSIEKGIRELQTAYSVDKVVEELETLKDGYDHSCLDNAYQRGVEAGAKWIKKKAIEIVKQGGVGKVME